MAYLFGHLYDVSGVPPFSHDWQMMRERGVRRDGLLVKPFFSNVDNDSSSRPAVAEPTKHYSNGEDDRLQAVDPIPHEATGRSPAEGRRVYIGGLPPGVTVYDVVELFGRYEV